MLALGWQTNDGLPPNGRGQSHVTSHLKFCLPIISLESVKLGTSNVVSWLIHGVLVHKWQRIAERYVSGSSDLFKSWEISDNISETVQDSDMVAMEV